MLLGALSPPWHALSFGGKGAQAKDRRQPTNKGCLLHASSYLCNPHGNL
jgi:hypothetical protein